jgi:hypothetical protein
VCACFTAFESSGKPKTLEELNTCLRQLQKLDAAFTLAGVSVLPDGELKFRCTICAGGVYTVSTLGGSLKNQANGHVKSAAHLAKLRAQQSSGGPGQTHQSAMTSFWSPALLEEPRHSGGMVRRPTVVTKVQQCTGYCADDHQYFDCQGRPVFVGYPLILLDDATASTEWYVRPATDLVSHACFVSTRCEHSRIVSTVSSELPWTCKSCLRIPRLQAFRQRLWRDYLARKAGMPTRPHRPLGLTGGHPSLAELRSAVSTYQLRLASALRRIRDFESRGNFRAQLEHLNEGGQFEVWADCYLAVFLRFSHVLLRLCMQVLLHLLSVIPLPRKQEFLRDFLTEVVSNASKHPNGRRWKPAMHKFMSFIRMKKPSVARMMGANLVLPSERSQERTIAASRIQLQVGAPDEEAFRAVSKILAPHLAAKDIKPGDCPCIIAADETNVIAQLCVTKAKELIAINGMCGAKHGESTKGCACAIQSVPLPVNFHERMDGEEIIRNILSKYKTCSCKSPLHAC